ncbi:MAG: threonine synthase [Acidimicrobiia bacterium]|nr:threonine synthase [Acidimicrobiia bacterium]
MQYVSTRGLAPALGFADVLLEGLARDGGLYVPAELPSLPTPPPAGDYVGLAAAVMAPFADVPDLAGQLAEAYAGFDHPDVVPLVELAPGTWVQELFHGPTLAFKDLALQLVGRLMDAELQHRGDRRTIVVATSGDTGSAAIEACVGRDTLDIVVLHPAGRTSDVQRRQMTTVAAPNVHNVAIEGTFDDCQDLVKALFGDGELRDELRLGAMNSINWGRVLAQIPYYVEAGRRVGPCDVVVPSGNFGNVLAGWYAKRMGAPIERLVIASNRNDILARWANTGALVAEEVVPTLSPSMDIQVSSNHERLLFELLGRDAESTRDLLTRFRTLGSVEAPRSTDFLAASVDDATTLAEITATLEERSYLADPHTAVGLRAARVLDLGRDRPVVCLATAHPAKFPDAVEQATGIRPALPERLADLFDRDEHYDVLPADPAVVGAHVRAAVAAGH